MGVVTWMPVCTAIGVLNLIAFGVQCSLGMESGTAWEGLAFQADHPQWYQYITSLFLHGSWFHLTSNAFALFAFGCTVEKSCGKSMFLLIYFISGIGGNLLFQMVNVAPDQAIGASGAIFGIICSMAFIEPKAWVIVPGSPLPVPIAIFAAIFLANEFFQMKQAGDDSSIAHIAHIGGGLFGAFVGRYMTKNRSSASAPS